jgi:hypothetical protein
MTRQTFFEHAIFERDLGDDFLELPVLGPQLLDFVAGGFADGVACELLLASFQELLIPALRQAEERAIPLVVGRDEIRDVLIAIRRGLVEQPHRGAG